MTEDKRRIPAKRFPQLALSPEQREPFHKLALAPGVAKAFKQIGAQARGCQPYIREVRAWIAQVKHEIAELQREIAAKQAAVNGAEAWLRRELRGDTALPPPRPVIKSLDTPTRPRQTLIAQGLRALGLTREAANKLGIAETHRRLDDWEKFEAERTGRKAIIFSRTSVARAVGRRES